MRGVYCLFTTFDTIVGVREPNYGDVCQSLCMLVLKKKTCFLIVGCDIFVIDVHAGFQEKLCF